jgi:hypothetical protein
MNASRRIWRRNRAQPVATPKDPASIEIALRSRFPHLPDHDVSLLAWWASDLSRDLGLDPMDDVILRRLRKLQRHHRLNP